MEKFWTYCLLLVIVLSGCTLNKVSPIEENHVPVEKRLHCLNDSYDIVSPTQEHQCYNAPQNDADTTDTRALKVAQQDAAGAIAVAECGVYFGWAPYIFYPTVLMAGVLASCAEYETQKENSSQISIHYNENGIEAIDLRNPIFPFTSLNQTYLDQYIGSEMGLYHNYIITQLFQNPNYGGFYNGSISVMETILDILDEESLFLDYDRNGIYNTLTQYGNNTQEILNNCARYQHPIITDIVSQYIEGYRQISLNEGVNYTNSFMRIIEEAMLNGELSTLEAKAINGSISIYYYSSLLWNTYIPSLSEPREIVYYDFENDIWYLTGLGYARTFFGNNNNVSYIGIPHYSGNVVTEIFFSDEITQAFFSDSPSISNWSGVPIVVTDSTTFFQEFGGDFFIEDGTYMIQQVPDRNELYYIDIN